MRNYCVKFPLVEAFIALKFRALTAKVCTIKGQFHLLFTSGFMANIFMPILLAQSTEHTALRLTVFSSNVYMLHVILLVKLNGTTCAFETISNGW
jgi:hypothetical protein